MIIKLDMKNAFDYVKLSFLYQVLLSFGFSVEFVILMKACTDGPGLRPLLVVYLHIFSKPLEDSVKGVLCCLSFIYPWLNL